MKKLFKCRVCGYIAERVEVPTECPACGIKGNIFEEYKSDLSETRRKLLDRHFHPIVVHLPLGTTIITPGISILLFFDMTGKSSTFLGFVQTAIFIMPAASLLAILTGVIDSKLRFKKLNTPFLNCKSILSVIFFTVSAAMLLLQLYGNLSLRNYKIAVLVYSLSLLCCGSALGLIGGKIAETKIRG